MSIVVDERTGEPYEIRALSLPTVPHHLFHILQLTSPGNNYVGPKADKVFPVPRSGAQVILRYGDHDRINRQLRLASPLYPVLIKACLQYSWTLIDHP